MIIHAAILCKDNIMNRHGLRQREAVICAFLPVLPGADLVIVFKSRRKVFNGRITEGFGHRGYAPAAVRQKDGGGGHAGLRFFLEKGFSVMLLKKPFCLPGAKSQFAGKLLQGQVLVLIKEIIFYNYRGFIGGDQGSGRCAGSFFLFKIANQPDEELTQKGFHLELVTGIAVFQLCEQILHQRGYVPGILAEPERGPLQEGEDLPGAVRLRAGQGLGTAFFFRFQINTEFTHGILQMGRLGMLHMGAGDIKGAGLDIIKPAVDSGAAVTFGYIMDFIAAAAVAVAGNGAQEFFIDNIEGLEPGVTDGKTDIQIAEVCSHNSDPFRRGRAFWKPRSFILTVARTLP